MGLPTVRSSTIDRMVIKYKDAALHTVFEKGIVISFIVSMLWKDSMFYKAVANYAMAADVGIERAVREAVDGAGTAPVG